MSRSEHKELVSNLSYRASCSNLRLLNSLFASSFLPSAGKRGGRGGRGGGRKKEPAPTAEELDKELDNYLKAR